MVDERVEGARTQAAAIGWTAVLAVIVMLVALALAWYFWFPPRAGPFVLRVREAAPGARGAIAPPGRPLVLEIAMPPSTREEAPYDVSIVEAATGASVLVREALVPAEGALRIGLPGGLDRSGRYDVTIHRHGRTEADPGELNRHFFIATPP